MSRHSAIWFHRPVTPGDPTPQQPGETPPPTQPEPPTPPQGPPPVRALGKHAPGRYDVHVFGNTAG
ncbi:MAG TPA: hypothetical protein VLF18_05455 [Tahibacter sp.]|uniref:hypothetical protein n=1 Tax=Tahibacter sp. TaxID=2056211 RepID=UPI002BC38C18|nr:hypothetical protein [Tahibacter sp.]HSX59625.1 hypothetical protein [Tahibacter sp.]